MGNSSENYTEILPGGLYFEMIRVEGGIYKMGSKNYDFEQPVHEVTVPDFYIGKYPVTQEVWELIMKENPSRFKGKKHPVERVSWEDTQLFIKKLYGLTGSEYRLPSEAEWEYAARGGKYSRGLTYARSNKLKEVGWYINNSNGQTQPVGLKLSNELGIYDMSGNVREWCADHWHGNYKGAPLDGSAWIEGGNKESRVVRGGSWYFKDLFCRPSVRFWSDTDNRDYDIGLRLARSCPPNP